MRRLLLGIIAVLGLGAAYLAPTAEPAAPEASYRLVSSAVLVCPRSTGAGAATSVLGAVVAGPADGPGSAVLQPMEPGADLVRLAAPGDPVALQVEGRSLPPVLVQAVGSWAPTSIAGVSARHRSGTSQGLSSAACAAPSPEWWFVGGGSQIGREAALLVGNPAQEPARFDINLSSGGGPVQALASKGIDLGPGASVRLRLDALAPDEDLLAIQVRATSGRVAAALRDVAVPSDGQPRGVDFIPAAQAPGTRLVVAGIPAGTGRRDLVLVNPGSQFATITPRLLTESGPVVLPELATIAVPAGAVIQVDLARVLQGRAGTLDLTSDVPVTGGVRAEWGAATREVTWQSAVPLIGGPDPMGGAAAVPSGPGLATSVVVAAPDGDIRGTLTTITVDSPDVAALTGGPLAGDQGDRDAQDDPGAQVVLPAGAVRTQTIDVTVPGGSQRTFIVAGDAADAQDSVAGLTTLVWRSDPGSGPASVAHLVLDADEPLATGYPWWPVASSVRAVEVREDLGILAPTG